MDLLQLTEAENLRQKNTLNLIASENYPSLETLTLLGSVWSNKYGEGYPGKRYYAGNQNTDTLEDFAKQKALQIFDSTGEYGVNLQVLSGSPANSMVFLSVLEAGDTIMSLNLANGGHLSHLHSTSNWNKFFKHVNYDVKEVSENTFEIDQDNFVRKLEEHKPKLVIIGFSAYPRSYQFADLCLLAHKYNAFVLADIAHINGLVAAGLHDSPFKSGIESADFISMTTHKTFRGPRGAMVFAKNYLPEYLEIHFKDFSKPPKSLIEILDKTIFPGTSGGPHFNKIAAIARSCQEILGEEKHPDGHSFRVYSQNTLDNTKALENGLLESGLEIVSPTQNHLCLAKLNDELDSLEIQQKLESIGIITNRNSIPFDTKSAWRPSGMRFGMAALTSRGISKQQSLGLGRLIGDYILDKITYQEAIKEVDSIVNNLSWWY